MSSDQDSTPSSHRDQEKSSWTGLLGLLGILIALIVGGVVAFVVLTGGNKADDKTSGPSMPKPTLKDSPSSSASDDPSASPKGEVTTPADLPTVKGAVARRLNLNGDDIGFDDSISNQKDHLIPNSTRELSRWDERGMPESPSTQSVVIVGKMESGAALALLPETKAGDEITIKTDEGEFTYTVTEVGKIPVAGQVDNPQLADSPGRLVLVGAAYDDNGDRTDQDTIVLAQLTKVSKN